LPVMIILLDLFVYSALLMQAQSPLSYVPIITDHSVFSKFLGKTHISDLAPAFLSGITNNFQFRCRVHLRKDGVDAINHRVS
jgi:hypothetical protein